MPVFPNIAQLYVREKMCFILDVSAIVFFFKKKDKLINPIWAVEKNFNHSFFNNVFHTAGDCAMWLSL